MFLFYGRDAVKQNSCTQILLKYYLTRPILPYLSFKMDLPQFQKVLFGFNLLKISFLMYLNLKMGRGGGNFGME